MAFNITGIIEPVVLGTAGPTYATQQNTAITAIDNHDHTTGKGLPVTPAGMNINANLSYTGFGPINMSWASLTPQTLPTPAVHPTSLFSDASGNLYYENNSGVQIQVTSGSTIQPNGTGTANGFYNFGGTGYATPVKAGYNQLKALYSFSNTSVAPDATGTNLANVSMGRLYIADPSVGLIAGSLPLRVGKTWDGTTNFSPAGGMGFAVIQTAVTANGVAQDGYQTVADTVQDSSYAYTALQLWPLTTAAANWGSNKNFGYGLRLNYGQNGGTQEGTVALIVNATAAAGGTSIRNAFWLGVNCDPSSATPVGIGFGPRTAYFAPSAAASGFTQVALGVLDAVWWVVGSSGGFKMAGATNGTSSTVAGFQLQSSSSIDYIGINQAPNLNYDLAIGTLGASGSLHTAGGARFAGAVVMDSTLNVASTSTLAVTNTGVLGVTGTVIATSTVQGTIFYPTTAGTGPTAVKGGSFLGNQVLGFAEISSAGSVTSNWGVVSTDSFSSTGICVVTLTNAPGNATAIVCGSAASTGSIVAGTITGATVTVRTYSDNGSTLANRAFHIFIVGAPA